MHRIKNKIDNLPDTNRKVDHVDINSCTFKKFCKLVIPLFITVPIPVISVSQHSVNWQSDDVMSHFFSNVCETLWTCTCIKPQKDIKLLNLALSFPVQHLHNSWPFVQQSQEIHKQGMTGASSPPRLYNHNIVPCISSQVSEEGNCEILLHLFTCWK